jgi:hypothetical protein
MYGAPPATFSFREAERPSPRLEIGGSKLHLQFSGKRGKEQEVVLRDRRPWQAGADREAREVRKEIAGAYYQHSSS